MCFRWVFLALSVFLVGVQAQDLSIEDLPSDSVVVAPVSPAVQKSQPLDSDEISEDSVDSRI